MNFFINVCCLYLICLLGFNVNKAENKLSGKKLAKIISKVNSAKTTWTAGENFSPDISTSYLKKLAGTLLRKENFKTRLQSKCRCGTNSDLLPKNFDSRERWSMCPSIGHVYEQGNCGACWAIAPVSTLADRLCIASEGKFSEKLSSQGILSCCYKCKPEIDGCEGGWTMKAWKFIQRHGAVTGGDYNSTEGCQPYLIPPCEHHVDGDGSLQNCEDTDLGEASKCQHKCYNEEYKDNNWKNDLHKTNGVFIICPCQAMQEIYERGPLQTTHAVYEDFYTYKSGVYEHIDGDLVGFHAVRVIGWGEEKGNPYWLAINSWNEHWGDNGTFKIARGYNECFFEEEFVTAYISEFE